MEFIRENILKIITFIVILIIGIIIFTVMFGKKTIVNNPKTYAAMEENLLTSAKKYVDKNRDLLPKDESETSKVNMDTLVNFGYMKELNAIEDENVVCSGYVEILVKNEEYLFIPYLKCGKYYETKTLVDYLKDNVEVVNTGDGLYEDGKKYVYKGENPNNYVLLGDRLYRIIEINEDNEIRLITNRKIDQYLVWDDRYNTDRKANVGINDFSKSRLKEYLNQLIDVNNDGNDNYIFSEQELQKIIPHDICIGKRPSSDGSISVETDCQAVEADQRLGLVTVSEYARASIDPNCKSIYDKSCMNYNYFSRIGSTFRTLTATTDNSYQVFMIDDSEATLSRASNSFSTYITVFIDNLSLYDTGDGSYENPYRVR